MDPNLTELVFILDSSGSMLSKRSEMIAGLNGLLAEQKREPGNLRITLTQFNTETWTPWLRMPPEEVGGLKQPDSEPDVEDPSRYVPYICGGSTALHDAVATTVDRVGERLAELPEEQRPRKVIVVILTDGQENSSRSYTMEDVRTRVEHQQETYGWSFVFLGVGIDAYREGASIGVDQTYTRSYEDTGAGVTEGYAYANSTLTELRNS